MKCLLLLAILLPAVFTAPQERFLIGSLQIDLHLDKALDVVKQFAHSGMGQTACVTACGSALSATGVGALVTMACAPACTQVLASIRKREI